MRAGRPIVPLFLGSQQWAVLGFHVAQSQAEVTSVTGVLTTLDGGLLVAPQRSAVEHPTNGDVATSLVRAIATLSSRLIRADRESSSHRNDRQLLGAGVALGGHVHNGAIIQSQSATRNGLVDANLVVPLAEKLGLPVVLENDVNSYAVVKSYSHEYPEPDIAIVVVFDEGIGGGLIVDGNVYRGWRGMAGEIGHIAITEGEYPKDRVAECSCGKRGHIDALATPSRILRQLDLRSLDEAAGLPGRTNDQISVEGQVFASAGRALGAGLVYLIDILTPVASLYHFRRR